MIALDPEIAAIYQRSTSVSCLNGNSHNLMKSKHFYPLLILWCSYFNIFSIIVDAKRRRTKKQIKEAKIEEERKQAEISVKLAEHAALLQRTNELQDMVRNQETMQRTLDQLVDNGLIKRTGNNEYGTVDTFDEHVALKR